MSPGDPLVRLRHGTTRKRAESILRNGPDASFREPGETFTIAGGFSTAPEVGPYSNGTPEEYANGKAMLFPEEGGPAILEIDVPAALADLAIKEEGERRFDSGWGLEELLEAWPALFKRIVT